MHILGECFSISHCFFLFLLPGTQGEKNITPHLQQQPDFPNSHSFLCLGDRSAYTAEHSPPPPLPLEGRISPRKQRESVHPLRYTETTITALKIDISDSSGFKASHSSWKSDPMDTHRKQAEQLNKTRQVPCLSMPSFGLSEICKKTKKPREVA